MCGICGYVSFGDESWPKATLPLMTRTLTHRGPDGQGWFEGENVGLGHARLAVIDLSDAASQPMTSSCGRYTLVFNGEIYNYRQLREELQSDQAFTTASDTEVVLRAWQRWSHHSLSRLNGIFAIAIWDSKEKSLFLARDRWGVKPLYVHSNSNFLVFGSEIKAILASGKLSPAMEVGNLSEFLHYGHSLGENTLFTGVRKISPGHFLKCDETAFEQSSYWRP